MEGYNPHTSLLPAGNGHITAMSGGGEAPNGYNPTQSLLLTSQVPISAHRGGGVPRETIIEGRVFTIDDPAITVPISGNNKVVLQYFGLDGLPDEDKKEVLKDLYKTDFDYPFKYDIMQKILGILIREYFSRRSKQQNTGSNNDSTMENNNDNDNDNDNDPTGNNPAGNLLGNFFKDLVASFKDRIAKFTGTLEQGQEHELEQEQEQQTALELSSNNDNAVAAVLGLSEEDLESPQQESVGVAENVVIEKKPSLSDRLKNFFTTKEVDENKVQDFQNELDNVPIDPITFTTDEE